MISKGPSTAPPFPDRPSKRGRLTALLEKEAAPDAGQADAALSRFRLRPTPPRIAVLSVLQASLAEGMSAADILQALSDNGTSLALSAVYLALRELVQCGLVTRREPEKGKTMFAAAQEARYAKPVAPRLHQATCRVCRRSTDVRGGPWFSALADAVRRAGMNVSEEPLRLSVVCAACMAQLKSPN